MLRARTLLPLLVGLSAAGLTGCIAIKPVVSMAKSDEAFLACVEAGCAEDAIYEHTLAEQYRMKAREEWGYSDYGDAESLAKKAATYALQGEEIARYGATGEGVRERGELIDELEGSEGIVPEDRVEEEEDEFTDELDNVDLEELLNE